MTTPTQPIRLNVEKLNIDQRTDRAVYITSDPAEIDALTSIGNAGAAAQFMCETRSNIMTFGAIVAAPRVINEAAPPLLAFDLAMVINPDIKACIAYQAKPAPPAPPRKDGRKS